MGAEATLYLTERGVQVVGTDAWSWDAPFSHTAKRWAETRDPSIIWEGHKAGRIRPYYQIEKLTNSGGDPGDRIYLQLFSGEDRACECGMDPGGGVDRIKVVAPAKAGVVVGLTAATPRDPIAAPAFAGATIGFV